MKVLLVSLTLVLVACSSQPNQKSSSVSNQSKPQTGVNGAAPLTQYDNVIGEIECKNKNDIRKITNSKVKSGGCAVDYTKFSETNQVAVAKYNMDHCLTVFDRIKSKLEDAGFSCD